MEQTIHSEKLGKDSFISKFREERLDKKRLALAKTPAGRREAFAAPFVASSAPWNKRGG